MDSKEKYAWIHFKGKNTLRGFLLPFKAHKSLLAEYDGKILY